MSLPNQKKIIIQRSSDTARKDFFKVSNDSLESALYNLQSNSFKLWIYFADNKQGYTMDLYPVDFMRKASVSKSTYDRAFKDLIEKGYLIQSQKQKNLYIFREVSETAEQPDIINSLDTEDYNQIIKDYF